MIEKIKELRALTLMGMAECKAALTEAEGDVSKAVELLKKRGLRKTETVFESVEGQVRARMDHYFDGEPPLGVIAEVNCQTDFAAKSETFDKLVDSVLNTESHNVASSKKYNYTEEYNSLCNVLREQIKVRRVQTFRAEKVHAYNHIGGKIAALVGFNSRVPVELADHVAMHIAAAAPQYVDRTQVPTEVSDSKREAFRTELPTGKKPEQLEKILEGKMNKWFGEVCLVDQQSLITPGKTIKEILQDNSVTEFVRYERGEKL